MKLKLHNNLIFYKETELNIGQFLKYKITIVAPPRGLSVFLKSLCKLK